MHMQIQLGMANLNMLHGRHDLTLFCSLHRPLGLPLILSPVRHCQDNRCTMMGFADKQSEKIWKLLERTVHQLHISKRACIWKNIVQFTKTYEVQLHLPLQIQNNAGIIEAMMTKTENNVSLFRFSDCMHSECCFEISWQIKSCVFGSENQKLCILNGIG